MGSRLPTGWRAPIPAMPVDNALRRILSQLNDGPVATKLDPTAIDPPRMVEGATPAAAEARASSKPQSERVKTSS